MPAIRHRNVRKPQKQSFIGNDAVIYRQALLLGQGDKLTDKQFVDAVAVAVAMITPGPVFITFGFIGFLIAGFPGALVAALATFIPCYLFTILPAPYFKKYGKVPGVLAFIDGITAAAIGAITGSVIVIAKRSIIDIPTASIAAITIVLLWKFKKLQEPVIIATAAIVGLMVYPLLQP